MEPFFSPPNQTLIRLFLRSSATVLDEMKNENAKLFCISCLDNIPFLCRNCAIDNNIDPNSVVHGCRNGVYLQDQWRFDKGIEKLVENWELRKKVFGKMHLFYKV